MAIEATTPVQVSTEHALLTRRNELVAEWAHADAELVKAQEAEQSAPKPSAARATAAKARLSWGAVKATRVHAVKQAELDLLLAGVEFDPFEFPVRTRATKTRFTKSPEELKEGIAKVRALRKTLDPKTQADVVHTCDVRIASLLKAAERQGVKLS